MNPFTTKKELARKLDGSRNQAIMDYGDKVIAAWESRFNKIKAEVYELVETEEETGYPKCECRLALIEKKQDGFEDVGHAVEWALRKIQK